jgi:hypothetical protein
MTRKIYTTITLLFLLATPLLAQRPPLTEGAESIQAMLKAHGAWTTPPLSIQIEGRSTKGAITEPVRIMATAEEEVRTEYGERHERLNVAARTAHFNDDGKKVKRQPTPSGFAQLDVTSVFFLSRLLQAPVRASKVEALGQDGSLRMTASTGRKELHYSQYTVEDTFDLYIHKSGLLSGISRSVYQERPLYASTLDVTFSDYRDTNGVWLPYRITRYVNRQLIETINVDRYTVDVPAPSSLFIPRRSR